MHGIWKTKQHQQANSNNTAEDGQLSRLKSTESSRKDRKNIRVKLDGLRDEINSFYMRST